MALWTLVGSRENWITALGSAGIWGVRPGLEREWKRLMAGDFVLFYCTSPVSGVIGVGSVTAKFKQDTPLWPDEVASGKVIYPYRFEFKTAFLVPESEWKSRRIRGSDVGLTYPFIAGGLNEIANEVLAKNVSERILTEFGVQLGPEGKRVPEPSLDHSGVQQMLFELGTLQRFFSHKEYGMERERLDVVWRKIETGSPTYVFEVQVGGDLHHALGKLKHAYDKWNSHPILVLTPEDIPKAKELLSGTFHEAKEQVKLITLHDIQELYKKKKEWSNLERTLGIFT